MGVDLPDLSPTAGRPFGRGVSQHGRRHRSRSVDRSSASVATLRIEARSSPASAKVARWRRSFSHRHPRATIAGAVSLRPDHLRTYPRTPLLDTDRQTAHSEGGFAYGPWPSLPGFWAVGFPAGRDTPGRQRIAAMKAAGTPVDIVVGPPPAARRKRWRHCYARTSRRPRARRRRASPSFPWSNCLQSRAGLCWRSSFPAMAVGAILTRPSARSCSRMVSLSSAGTACVTSGAESPPNGQLATLAP